MTYGDRFKDLHHLILNLEYLITDLGDKDKVYSIIDRLLEYHSYVNYGHEYPRIHFDTEVYAIIEDCFPGPDQIHVKCGPSSENSIDVLAELGLLMPEELHTVRRSIRNFKRGE